MNIDIFNTNNKYQIIYADPPWAYKQGGRGAAKIHYDTMSVREICDLPIKRLKTDDAFCFMWTTFPNIAEALEVMKSWGFIYKTAAFVWVKKTRDGKNWCGLGSYTRANAEICLLGVSKKTKARKQVQSRNVRQIIEAVKNKHSEKPKETRDRIVELVGGGKRIELFARDSAEGWDCWGNEAPK